MKNERSPIGESWFLALGGHFLYVIAFGLKWYGWKSGILVIIIFIVSLYFFGKYEDIISGNAKEYEDVLKKIKSKNNLLNKQYNELEQTILPLLNDEAKQKTLELLNSHRNDREKLNTPH